MLLRAGMWVLTALTVAIGVLATFVPGFFYQHTPWVSLNPPYSEHLMRDYGAMNLALGLVFVVTAVTMNLPLVRTVLGAFLIFNVAHLIFHRQRHRPRAIAQLAC